MNPEIIRTTNFVEEAASFILAQARIALAERGEFRIGLSGGNTPRPVYAELGRIGCDLPWHYVRFTFGDERCVPPNDKESNFRMAREALFEPCEVPERSILRLRGEVDPAFAAREYEEALAGLAAEQDETIYRHDLLLLGMGDDGHCASLFPGTTALEEQSRPVVANFVPRFEAFRLTMTYPLLNQSRQVLFLVQGDKNPEVLERVLAGDEQYPAARIRPASGRLTWMIGERA